MATIKKLIKIQGYIGLYFNDQHNIFDTKEVSVSQLNKKVKPPYIIFSRFYDNKKSVYQKYTITNNAKTTKRILDEISAERKMKQIEKSFETRKEAKILNDIFYDWIEYRKNQMSQKHYENNFWFFEKYIKDKIGKYKANDITTRQIQTIVNSILKEGKAPRTAKTVKDILSPTFKHGIKNKYCKNNPAEDIKIPKFDNQRYFTIEEEQAKKLYDIIMNYPDITIRGIFIFLLHGRRKKEVLRLRWENINISQKLYFLEDFKNKSRKNQIFPLSDIQMEILNKIGIKKTGYIFIKEDGNPYKDIRWHWDKIRKQLDFYIKLHDLRHLIGFIAVNQGVPLKAISKTLGHSNTQITERYSNVSIDLVRETLDTVFDTIEHKDMHNVSKSKKLEQLKALFPDKSNEELIKVLEILS